MKTHAPVALFVYNRPWHTQQTVEALLANREAAKTDVYIFSDAPKNAAASQLVNEVRTYIKKVSGFQSVVIIERESNFGLARSIIDGVTGICNKFGRIIVMEDDLITSSHFLSYMNEALDKYENNEQVMQIAGYMFPVDLKIQEDSLFLPFTSSWGWATWKRAWDYFDEASIGFEQLVKNRNMKYAFNLNGNIDYFKMLKSQLSGQNNSWAVRWYLSVFLMKGVVLYPAKTLVNNLGFDGSGVNCVASSIEEDDIEEGFIVNSFPQSIEISKKYKELVKKIPKPKLNIRTIINSLKKLRKR
jgi:hypothetical protein